MGTLNLIKLTELGDEEVSLCLYEHHRKLGLNHISCMAHVSPTGMGIYKIPKNPAQEVRYAGERIQTTDARRYRENSTGARRLDADVRSNGSVQSSIYYVPAGTAWVEPPVVLTPEGAAWVRSGGERILGRFDQDDSI